MATLPLGSRVTLAEAARRSLRLLPGTDMLRIVVHPAALRAPSSPHTQVAGFDAGEPCWLGAMGEELLEPVAGESDPCARDLCARRLLQGSRLWEIVRPGSLLRARANRPLSTIYDGPDERPWIVLGETAGGELIAVPLNEPGNPKWFTPILPRVTMFFDGNEKDSQVELAHVWTLPASIGREGRVLPKGIALLEEPIRKYFELP